VVYRHNYRLYYVASLQVIFLFRLFILASQHVVGLTLFTQLLHPRVFSYRPPPTLSCPAATRFWFTTNIQALLFHSNYDHVLLDLIENRSALNVQVMNEEMWVRGMRMWLKNSNKNSRKNTDYRGNNGRSEYWMTDGWNSVLELVYLYWPNLTHEQIDRGLRGGDWRGQLTSYS